MPTNKNALKWAVIATGVGTLLIFIFCLVSFLLLPALIDYVFWAVI